MSNNKSSGRPHGRPQSKPTNTGGVHKRGSGLGIGKVGNVDYSERKAGSSSQGVSDGSRSGKGSSPLGGIGGLGGYSGSSGSTGSSSHSPLGGIGGLGGLGGSSMGGSGGSGKRSGSGGLLRIILIIALVLFLMNMLGMCGTSSTSTGGDIAVSTPSATAVSNSSSATSIGHWNPPSTTYEDTNLSDVSTSVAGGAREKFTKLLGNGNDQVTVLIYMCGTDLETNYGMATSDLNEMLYAAHSDKVNIVVQTGGTRRWQNSVMSNTTNQRWLVADRSVVALDKNVGKKAMTDPDTLADFIQWGAEAYPANRYFLILWDHGGGSLSGYAYDELFPNGTMTVDEISGALKKGGIKFDAVGFDACLMANMETAVAVEPYADYLIASEETEPGTGWYYTNWVTALSKNSSLPTTSIGKAIIDDFIAKSYESSSRDKTSLSLIDLAEFSGTVPQIFNEFAKQITDDIKGDNFQSVATARSNTKEFATSTKIDQIDLIHFCKNLGTTSASSLADSIQSCVKYNRCNNMNNAYGLSIYFPYYSPRNVSGAVEVYENLGMDSDYTNAVRSFATLSASGQITQGQSTNSLFDIINGGSSASSDYSYEPTNILDLLLGGSSSSSYSDYYGSSSYGSGSYGGYYGGNSYGSGYSGSGNTLIDLLGGMAGIDTNSLELFSNMIGRRHLDPGHLVLTENAAGQQVLSLGQDDWDLIDDIRLNVWVDDGTGYIDLGLDEVYNFDDEGSLIVDYSGTWMGINGQIVSFYATGSEYVDENNWTYSGYVPVMYNGERANILIEMNPDHPDGEVLGIRKVYEEGTEAKGFIEQQDGDKIDYLCDYYDYDGNYLDTYYLNEGYVVNGELVPETMQLESGTTAKFGYRLSDVYNANSWTPMLEYKN